MKTTSYSGKAPEALVKALLEKRESLRLFRFSRGGKNVKEGLNLRKEIARIMTELNASK
jgi:ribosomal protein L29